jgi:hypothetical protein
MLTSRSTKRGELIRLLTVCGALTGAACQEERAGSGTLVVPFELGNRRTCETFEVYRVRGELDDGDAVFVDEVSCESGLLRFENVPAGNYNVRLFARDKDGVVVMDSLDDVSKPMSVVGDGTTVIAEDPVLLMATPARLYVRWSFGFGSCKSAGIERFDVSAWRSDGAELLLEGRLDCEDDGDEDDHYRAVKDVKRTLAGDHVAEVTVVPLDEGRLEVGDPVTFKFSPPGPGHDIRLSVTCDEDGCTGSGKLD